MKEPFSVQWLVREPDMWSRPFPFFSWEMAASALRNAAEACPRDSWRIIDGEGRWIVRWHNEAPKTRT